MRCVHRGENVKGSYFTVRIVGRMAPEESRTLLMRAGARLVPEFSNLRLFLVSDGLRGSLERQSQERGLTQYGGHKSGGAWRASLGAHARAAVCQKFSLPLDNCGVPEIGAKK